MESALGRFILNMKIMFVPKQRNVCIEELEGRADRVNGTYPEQTYYPDAGGNGVWYIIVVLVLYSFVLMMITYRHRFHRKRSDTTETKQYKAYVEFLGKLQREDRFLCVQSITRHLMALESQRKLQNADADKVKDVHQFGKKVPHLSRAPCSSDSTDGIWGKRNVFGVATKEMRREPLSEVITSV